MSRYIKEIVTKELTGLTGPSLYPFVESDEDKKDIEEYVGKEPSRKEKIKEGLKSTGGFIAGVLGIIFLLVASLVVCLSGAVLLAFIVGIFHQRADYPFFNGITFQIAGPAAVGLWIGCWIDLIIEEGFDGFLSGFF